ncbi:hypothetical protein ACVWZK_002123 [Bradyrhizobium sp. GM0.4]
MKFISESESASADAEVFPAVIAHASNRRTPSQVGFNA